MSWDESLHYAHQLMGVHPWTGYMIDMVALQQTLKEACHNMQVARENQTADRPSEHPSCGADHEGSASYTPEVTQRARHG